MVGKENAHSESPHYQTFTNVSFFKEISRVVLV